jgi:hypothetical protein
MALTSSNITIVRICETIRFFVPYLNDNAMKFIAKQPHIHIEESAVTYDGGVFCEGCAPNLSMLQSFLNNMILILKKQGTNQISHGMLVFGLFKASNHHTHIDSYHCSSSKRSHSPISNLRSVTQVHSDYYW